MLSVGREELLPSTPYVEHLDIEHLADELCMVRGKDVVPRGHLRLETKFLYPDRSSVDLFVVNAMSDRTAARWRRRSSRTTRTWRTR